MPVQLEAIRLFDSQPHDLDQGRFAFGTPPRFAGQSSQGRGPSLDEAGPSDLPGLVARFGIERLTCRNPGGQQGLEVVELLGVRGIDGRSRFEQLLLVRGLVRASTFEHRIPVRRVA